MANKSQIIEFLDAEYPQTKCVVETVGGQGATIRHPIGLAELRPGGTVSGPVMMEVADVALYVAILGEIGLVAMTVTTSLTINFLRKPNADFALIAKCRLLKQGRSLVVGEVELFSEGDDRPVAHAVGTYSIPPLRQ